MKRTDAVQQKEKQKTMQYLLSNYVYKTGDLI